LFAIDRRTFWVSRPAARQGGFLATVLRLL
jgi:hypothetical protein